MIWTIAVGLVAWFIFSIFFGLALGRVIGGDDRIDGRDK